MDLKERNRRIAEAGRATRLKRKSQECKTFKFKVDRSSLTKLQAEQLKMQFIEAKWIYNYIIASDNIMSFDYKALVDITHKDKDGNDIPVRISYIGSSVKQAIIEQIKNQVKGLSTLKKRGHSIGKLKFKSEVNSINFKQKDVTYKLKGNRIKLQNIKKPIRINGISQLSCYDNIEYANAKVIYDGYDYYVSLTCFIDKELKTTSNNNIKGLDFGVKDTVICSNGDKYNISVEESERLKRLQAKLSKQKRYSNNWHKTRSLLRKEYAHLNNKKNDISNKIVHDILKDTSIVVMQDEQIKHWVNEKTSSKIHHSILGRLKSRLAHHDKVVVLSKWLPTTKYCSKCGTLNETLTLNDRIFVCPCCGNTEDRDIHAANNMIYFYLNGNKFNANNN